MPLPSSSLGAVSLMHQLPLTTNCSSLLALRGSGWVGAARVDGRQLKRETHLVLCLGLGQLDRLLEDAVLLVQLDCFLPVVKGASHMDVFGIVFPGVVSGGASCGAQRTARRTYHMKVYLPMAAKDRCADGVQRAGMCEPVSVATQCVGGGWEERIRSSRWGWSSALRRVGC
jgi:hypothetical protein